ncbi:MAG: iron-containing alcohol dehydrogenase [Opitutales bacterium]|nr:iron-containing alcohol dehydrogenase [Opitutales bacterium]
MEFENTEAITDFGRLPRLLHALGGRQKLAEWTEAFVAEPGSECVVLVTGGKSLERSGRLVELCRLLQGRGLRVEHLRVDGEPSDLWVDAAREAVAHKQPAVVVAVGGGSVLDAGKALAALLEENEPTKCYLEGVGDRQPSGRSLPWIALPTTAGTGSEGSFNAVLSRVGPDGFKKSLRHRNFRPHSVILDGELAMGCPVSVTAACGMDALTQLLEAHLSPKSFSLLDRWLEWGLECAFRSLPKLVLDPDPAVEPECRHDMAIAAYLSGIGLAHADLGTVHGFAGPLGARLPIPHGVVCGALLAPCMRETLLWLEANTAESVAVEKLSRAGRILAGVTGISLDSNAACRHFLIETLQNWTQRMQFPGFAQFGLDEALSEGIVESANNRQNPAQLSKAVLARILKEVS